MTASKPIYFSEEKSKRKKRERKKKKGDTGANRQLIWPAYKRLTIKSIKTLLFIINTGFQNKYAYTYKTRGRTASSMVNAKPNLPGLIKKLFFGFFGL